MSMFSGARDGVVSLIAAQYRRSSIRRATRYE
jgi:hypothetical protein